MRKIVCIFPENESTDFLLPIYKQLEILSGFVGYRFNTLDSQARNKFHRELNQVEDNSLLLFLGHGASNRLYGSVDNNGNKQILFDKDNIEQLRNKNFIGIACRSNEFAHNLFHNYIGFGDITSDFSEIKEERDFGDPHYMDWATIEDIVVFRQEFTEAIVEAIRLTHCENLLSMYKMIKLCFNKRIATLLVNKNVSNYRHIADLLFDVTNDIECHY